MARRGPARCGLLYRTVVQRGQEHRDRDGDGELSEEFSGNPRDECDRHKDRQEDEGDRDDGRRDLGHRVLDRISRRQFRLLLHNPLDIFNDHDRVIDDNADREHDSE